MPGSEKKFVELVRKIFEANDFIINLEPPRSHAFDFIAEWENKSWAVEVKFYRTRRPQTSLINAAAKRLQFETFDASLGGAILVISSQLDLELQKTLEAQHGVQFVDRIALSDMARSAPELVDQLAGLLEEFESTSVSAERRVIGEIKRDLSVKRIRSEDLETSGSKLCEKLRDLGKGKKHWKSYEDLCERILKYLFPNDIHGWHSQKRTDDGLNRFDLICRISPTTEFWSFLTDNLDSRYVLFEFKNYAGKIKQGQILTTEKYLLSQGLRRVGIILSRRGADDSAQKTIAGAMRENGKLMVPLNDDQVCEMLHAKDKGDDPSDILFALVDNFLMSLSR